MTNPVDWVQDRLDRSPVRELRYRYYPDRTVLCKKLGINDSVIYFSELACYPRLPVRLAKELGVDGDFHSVYREFQRDERKKFGFIFSLEDMTMIELMEHGPTPVQALCSFLGFSRADLGKGLCLQPSLLYRHARGQAKSLNEEFRLALLQAGVHRDLVDYLDQRQKAFAYAR